MRGWLLIALFIGAVACHVKADPYRGWEPLSPAMYGAPSAQCAEDLTKITPKMLDATGKLINSGFLNPVPNFGSLGDYDECATQYPFAQYCYISGGAHLEGVVNFPPIISDKTVNQSIPLSYWGVCIPRSCTTNDIAYVLSNLPLGKVNLTVLDYVSSCQRDYPLSSSPSAIATVCLIAVFVSLVLLATVADYFLDHKEQSGNAFSDPYEYGSQSVNAYGEKESLLKSDGYEALESGRGNRVHGNPSAEKHTYPLWMRMLLAFSFRRNFNKLTSIKTGEGHMGCLNGIRTMSMGWVLMGHTTLWGLYAPMTNVYQLLEAKSTVGFQIIANGFFSVDSFFYLSGFLVGLLTLRTLHKRGSSAKMWGMYYLHRFLRLTPLYMFVMLVYNNLSPFFGSGPLWGSQQLGTYCGDGWWKNLLYIQNFTDDFSKQCMGWAWYLANDMQFYWISPVFLYLFHRHAKAGVAFWNVVFWSCCAVTLALAIHYDYPADMFTNMTTATFNGLGPVQTGPEYVDVIYDKPYTRFGPYLMGMMGAYLYFCVTEDRNSRLYKWRPSKWVMLIGWILSLFFVSASVFGMVTTMGDSQWNTATSSVYTAFARPAWGFALAFIVFACLTGRAGLVNDFLSAPVWAVPARLTYAMYLVHPLVINVFFFNRKTELTYSSFMWMYFFFGNLITTFFFAGVVSLLVEAPLMNLEKVLLH